MKLLALVGALVALFSFSAYEISSLPVQQHHYEYSTNQVGTAQGLVWPTDLRGCVYPKPGSDPPLPKNVPHATWYNTGSPPLRFQKDVAVKVHFQNPNIINRDEGPNGHPSCNSTVFAYSDVDTRELWIPNPCKYPATDGYARLVCHEMGHINGWPGYHGD